MIIWNGNLTQLNDFLIYVNSLHEKLKFTLELQNDEYKINFLDLTLTLIDNRVSGV